MHHVNGGLRWRPIVPGSDLHCSLMQRATITQSEAYRRAYAIHRAAIARVGAKQEAPGIAVPEASVPITNEMQVRGDGCSTECA